MSPDPKFFRLSGANYDSFVPIAQAIEKYAPAALSKFYAHVGATPEVSSLFKSQAHIDGARLKQIEHWRHIFAKPLDDSYFARAEHIGDVHARIGLDPTWYIGGYAMVLEELIDAMVSESLVKRMSGKKLSAAISTLVKTALLDMDVALSAYFRAGADIREKVTRELGTALDEMARGDFSVPLHQLPDSFARLSSDFESMRQHMSDTLHQVSETAESISTGSGQISAASDDLARRTEQQAASLEETAAAMDEITSAVRGTAQGAAQVNQSVSEAHNNATEGGRIVQEAVLAMDDIEKSSQEIAQIINVIDGIAFQTNLLALNAGVEAARAGDAGKGFAVVANEVRALAQRSADAASNIKELIVASSKQVERGVERVGQTGQALERIVAKVAQIAELAEQIASSAAGQANGLQQVNSAVSAMDQMTQQNAAMVEQSNAAARSLAAEADQLATLVGNFQLATRTGSRPSSAPAPRAMRPMTRGNLALADDWTAL